MSGLLAVSTPYTVPAGLMDVLQAVLLVLVAYGLILALLFLAFQAPDVTLSELTVGSVLLPALLLLTLGRIRRREK